MSAPHITCSAILPVSIEMPLQNILIYEKVNLGEKEVGEKSYRNTNHLIERFKKETLSGADPSSPNFTGQ